jgi:hypothetical protein
VLLAKHGESCQAILVSCENCLKLNACPMEPLSKWENYNNHINCIE